MIVRVNVVLNRTVVVDSDGRFDNLCKVIFRVKVNSYRQRKNDGIKQNELRENDWTTDNLANNKRLFNCDNRRIETH